MRIVHCIFGLQTGGAEILTVALVNKMCSSNEVSVIVVNSLWDEAVVNQLDKRVNLYFIGRKEGSFNPIPIINLNILLYKLKPDIIHCHDAKMVKLIKVKGAKTVHTIHGMGMPVDSFQYYDLLIAISDAVYKDAVAKCSSRIKTIYNGISIESFKRRSNYFLNKDEPIKLVQVSRLAHKEKGQDVLLRALASLKTEISFKYTLDIIGSGESLLYLKELVRKLGIESSVNFLGEKNRDWLCSNLAKYHLLVQPSRTEGFGLTVLEGLAAGLPVLASDVDGPSEIIGKISKGFLFESGNIQSCADKLKRVFVLYKQNQVNEYVVQEKELLDTDYSITTCANNYLNEYKNLSVKEEVAVLNYTKLEHY